MKVQVTAQGIVGKDPDLKFSKAGRAWCKFPIAVTERKKGQDGQWEDGDTLWLDVISFGSPAEVAADTISKGNRVIVVGSLKRNEWEMQDGTPRVSLEVYADQIGLQPFPNRGGGKRAVRDDQYDAPF